MSAEDATRVSAQELQPFRGFDVTAPVPSPEAPPADLRSILGVLLRHWKLIAAVPLVAMIGTFIVFGSVPPQYKSTAEVLIVNPKVQSETTVRSTVGAPDPSAMSTEIALIQSKTLALRVAKELELDKDQQFLQRGAMSQLLEKLGLSQVLRRFGLSQQEGSDPAGQPEGGSGLSSAPVDATSPEQPSAPLDAAAEELRQRVQVERLGLSYVMSISITTPDPALSRRIVDAIAKNFFAEELEARSDARGRAAGWLKNWVAELRDSLSQTEGEIEKLKAESGLSDVGANMTGLSVNVTEQQMSELNKRLSDVRAEVMEKKLRLEQARRLLESGGDIQAIPDIMASTAITSLRQQQSELRWREQDLRSRFGDRHVEVVAVRAQLASINRQMADEAQHIITNLQSTYDLALEHQRTLEKNLRNLANSGSDNSSAYAKLRALQPAADAKRKLFEQALGDLDELSRRAAADDEGGRVIAPASLARPPSALRKIIIYVVVGVLATAVGALIAFLIEYLQTGFSTHAMAERTLGYPVITMIPVVRRRLRRISNEGLVEALMSEARSQLSTAVETARIVLGFSNSGSVPKVILLTSAVPGEGKSAVARLLATSSALSGSRTVLLDCDLRRGFLSRQFVSEPSGLAQVLDGETDIASVTTREPGTGLFVIPAGFAEKSPVHLLNSKAMQEAVAQLRQEYDYIVMDVPPILPVVDALTLAALADKIVMIVEWSRTSRTSVSEALKTLRFAGHSIDGIVLNKVDYRQLASYGYGFGKDYAYGASSSRLQRAIGRY
jgi:polysaccharide biosynthesis transport protein